MGKYIPLDALVAEIESKKKYAQTLGDNAINSSMQQFYDGMKQGCVDILCSINILEVKEVDLNKECRKYLTEHFNVYEDGILQSKRSGMPLDTFDVIQVAKHFFELGLQARIDKELVEEVYSHLDGIKDTADRMTSGNFMHNRAAIKFSANTIAKVLELMGLKAQKGDKV